MYETEAGEQREVGARVPGAGREDEEAERGPPGAGRFQAVSCFRPLPAYRDVGSGVVRIGYHPGKDGRAFEVPCGRCVGCKLDRRRQWSVRIMHEARLYDSNWFVTLTYDDAKNGGAVHPSLRYPDFQMFMKRLRKQVGGHREGPEGGFPLRFFCAGEYGGRRRRPHFHAILFNLHLEDAEKLMSGRYRSSTMEDTWKRGNCVLDLVTPASAAYVAGYSQKKVSGPGSRAHYEDVVDVSTGEVTARRPEFVAMSLKPGIGAWWYKKFGSDLFPHDGAVMDGRRYKVPRYYWERFKREADPVLVEEVSNGREARAAVETRKGESTPERRAVREELAERRELFFSDRVRDGE